MIRARYIVVIIIRGLSMLFALAAVTLIIAQMAHIAMDSSFRMLWINITRTPLTWSFANEIRWSSLLFAIAIGLWIFQLPLARLIAPRRWNTCPECGYNLRKLKSDRCPECGLAFTSEPQADQSVERERVE